MRRKDREIKELDKIMEIIEECKVCHLAFFDKEYPYVIPMNFGVQRKEEQVFFYFHGCGIGKKTKLQAGNPNVGFSMSCAHRLVPGQTSCETTMEYRSVCGNGILEIVEKEDKEAALLQLLEHYDKREKHEFCETTMKSVTVLRLKVQKVSGKALQKKE